MKPASSFIGRYLSEGEKEDLVQKERIRRRNVRVTQARHLANENALKIFKAVNSERDQRLRDLGAQLKTEWIKNKEAEIEATGDQYGKCLFEIGEGHQDVFFEELRIELLKEKLAQSYVKSKIRGKSALDEEKYCKEKATEGIKRQKDLRRKMHAFGSRVRQLSTASSEQQLPLKLNREDCLTMIEGTKMIVLDGDEPDARLAAEQEIKRYEESERLLKDQKFKHDSKMNERYLLAMEHLYKQEEMNKFLNKLEEIDDLHQFNGSDEKSDLESEREKAVELLFEKLGLPVKLSFLESRSSIFTTENSSRMTVESSSTPTHIIIGKSSVNVTSTVTPTSTVTSSISSGVTSSGNLSWFTTPYQSQSDSRSTRSFDLSNGTYTDDEKRKISEPKLNTNETILAGNLESADSTVNFTDSSNDWFLTDKSSTYTPSTNHLAIIQENESQMQVAEEPNISIVQNNASNEQPVEVVEDNKENLLDVLHNVVVRQRPVISTEQNRNEGKILDPQLRTLLSKAVQSEKMHKVLSNEMVIQNNSRIDQPFVIFGTKSSDVPAPIDNNDKFMKSQASSVSTSKTTSELHPGRERRELSTIIEIDTPRSSMVSNLLTSHCISKDVVNTNSLFENISENENGILEEPNLTLVSSVTSFSDDLEISSGTKRNESVPFIVTNVNSRITENNSSANMVEARLLTRHREVNDASLPNISKSKAGSSGTISLCNISALGQSITLDSASWNTCFSETERLRVSNISPMSLSGSRDPASGLISDFSNSKSNNSFLNNPSDDHSITDELLSNSLISFLAHEISANDSDSNFSHMVL